MIAIIGGNRTLLSNASSVSSNYEVVTMKYKEEPIMAHIKTADEEYITTTNDCCIIGGNRALLIKQC